jgi:zinc D-Ala-D-Ala carboxypeptidase
MNLTNNFSLKEMTQSQTALRNNLNNTPDEKQIENLQNLCEKILQPLREHYNLPIKVTSGFRSEKLATMIGSKSTSQHCKGEAVDFEIPGVDNKEVATKIKNEFTFDNRQMALIKDEQGYKEWQ